MVLLNAAVVGYYFAQNQYKFIWTRTLNRSDQLMS
jgi:hypothetical protein